MNNATFHKRVDSSEAIISQGHNILFLPLLTHLISILLERNGHRLRVSERNSDAPLSTFSKS